MTRLTTVCLAVAFGPIAVAAQSSGTSIGVAGTIFRTASGSHSSGTMVTGLHSVGNSSPQSAALTTHQPASTCPVSLSAQHKADGSLVRTGNAHPKGLGQWLHLALANTGSPKITAATVTVHGFSNKARVTETAGESSGSDAVMAMTVPLTTVSPRSAAGDVWVAGMTAVTRIDLDSVSFEDGQTRLFTSQDQCSVAPDPFMLIAGR